MLPRLIREGWQPIEVWFSYSLSFGMTAVYAYIGLLIWDTLRRESGSAPWVPGPRLARLARPLNVVGLVGAAGSILAIAIWLLFRYPGPAAIPGTIGSVLLVVMILGVTLVCSFIARGAGQRSRSD
jgi:hypothetical protein